jgi:hypothetical protein
LDLAMPASRQSLPAAALTAGGTDGNERLTVQTGAVLLAMLAVLGLTIVRIGQLTWLHLFLGLLLIGPIALKLASTGYRFARYYTSDVAYRRKGPPVLTLRLLGPLVVSTTLVVFASGVMLLALGPSSREPLLLIHKVAFFTWLAATTLHVLGHLPELRRGLLADGTVRAELLTATGAPGGGVGLGQHIGRLRLAPRQPGGPGRALALLAALGAGLILALMLIPDFAPWLHYHHSLHEH